MPGREEDEMQRVEEELRKQRAAKYEARRKQVGERAREHQAGPA